MFLVYIFLCWLALPECGTRYFVVQHGMAVEVHPCARAVLPPQNCLQPLTCVNKRATDTATLRKENTSCQKRIFDSSYIGDMDRFQITPHQIPVLQREFPAPRTPGGEDLLVVARASGDNEIFQLPRAASAAK